MKNKGVCPKCGQKVSVWKSIKPVFLKFRCFNCQTVLDISKPIIISTVFALFLAFSIGYPVGKMYGSQQISIIPALLIFLITALVIQFVFSLALANCKLELAKK